MLCHYAVSLCCVIIMCHYAVSLCCVIMLSVTLLNVVMLSVGTLNAIRLFVIVLNVVMYSAVAPSKYSFLFSNFNGKQSTVNKSLDGSMYPG
jgi:hypothetical protein